MKRALKQPVFALAVASLLALPANAAVKKESLIMYCSTNQSWKGESLQGFYTYPFTNDGKAQRIGSTIGMTAFGGHPWTTSIISAVATQTRRATDLIMMPIIW